MKKQIKKLSLNKKTISNLTAAEMSRQVGGDKTKGNTCATTCRCYPTHGNCNTWTCGRACIGW